MKQKLFTILTLLLCLCSTAWAQTDATFTMSSIFTGSNQSATVTSPVAATVTTTTTASNADDGKLGSDGNYYQIVLSSNTFTAASLNGYINTDNTSKNWGFQFSTDGGSTWGTEVTQANDGNKTAHNISVGVTIPSGANGIRIIRRAGSSTYVYSVTLTLAAIGPSISADNVNIEASATGGSIAYTVSNPVTGGAVTAAKKGEADWLTAIGTEATSPISFTTTANEGAERSATVTLTYTYNTNETVTKDVTITQAASAALTYAVTYDLDGGLYDGCSVAPTQAAVTSGTEITMPALTPTKADYMFLGWKSSANNNLYAPNANYTMTAAATTFTAQWQHYANNVDFNDYVIKNIDSGKTSKDRTLLESNYYTYSLNDNSVLDNSTDAKYQGFKMKKSGDYITFAVPAGKKVTFIFGYVETKPKLSIDGGAEETINVPATKSDNQIVTYPSAEKDRLFKVKTADDKSMVIKQIDFRSTLSTFALTSDVEVELTKTTTSQIAYENNIGTVTYFSANESVATVSNTGLITAVAGGKTTIYVSDPGSETVMNGKKTVTVLVPYDNPAAAESYTLDNSQYGFSDNAGKKYYFKNGFTITNTAGKTYGSANMGDAGTGMKFSASTQYTINVPSNVTVTYAVIKARNNYKNENSNAAANWGTVFGTDYSATALPWSNETPAQKDFELASAQTGGTLAFTPKGNQWQAIINLYTVTHDEERTVSFDKGEGTGTMSSQNHRGYTTFALPQPTFTYPSGKGFVGWLCSVDSKIYAASENYTMTAANTTFTAQYDDPKGMMIIRVKLNGGTSATTTGFFKGSGDVSVQSDKKFGSGSFAGLKLTNEKFKTGDIINVRITTVASGTGSIAIYDSDKSTVLYDTETLGVVGDNKFVLPAAVNDKTSLYICRTNDNGWNAFVDYIEVTRPEEITLNASGYATNSRKYDFEIFSGAKAYKATLNTTNNKITCTEVEAVPAGAGVLLFGDANAKVAIVNTTGATALTGNDLKGTTKADGSLAAFDGNKFYYALSGDTFKHYTGTAFVAGKAYFESDTELNAKAFALVFDEGETTAINAIEEVAPVTKTRKVVKNGRLVIETANGEFTVSGARVK